MNEEEARQHVRDLKTVSEAVNDAKTNDYDPPIKLLDTILPGGMSDEKLHDQSVYKAAFKEARKH